MLKKCVAVWLILLFIGLSFNAIGINVENSSYASFNGNILYVGGSGPGNYTKIQYAIDDSSDGDTVFVYDESSPYYENININKQISLIGENKEKTIIDGSRKDNVVILSVDGINIQGFTIRRGLDSWIGGGINIQSCNNTITGNIISDNNHGILLYQDWENDNNFISTNKISNSRSFGIWLYSSNNNSFLGNTIEKSGDVGLDISAYSNFNFVADNEISNNGNHPYYYKCGIKIHGCKGNTIVRNRLSSNTKNGIIVTNHDNGIISDNKLNDNGGGISFSSCKNNIVSNNTLINDGFMGNYLNNHFSDNTVNSKPILILVDESDRIIDEDVGQILVYNCFNLTFQNMKINNTACAIQLSNTNNCKIKNNNLVSNDKSGIEIDSLCRNITVIDNLILNNEEGIKIHGDNNTILNNNISNNIVGIYLYRNGDNNTISGNIISKNINGLIADKSNYNIIKSNEISYNKFQGLALFNVNHNVISSNQISNNIKGILIWHTLQNSGNLIVANNFIKNLRNAGFQSTWSFSKPMHKWEENYWDNYKGFGRKIILGKFAYFIWLDYYSQAAIWIFRMPWFEFDRNPAKEPYDIEV